MIDNIGLRANLKYNKFLYYNMSMWYLKIFKVYVSIFDWDSPFCPYRVLDFSPVSPSEKYPPISP